jgi:hypothetical protein
MSPAGQALLAWIDGSKFVYRRFVPDEIGWRNMDTIVENTIVDMPGVVTGLGMDGEGNGVALRVGVYSLATGNHARATFFSQEDETWSSVFDLEPESEAISGDVRMATAPDGSAVATWSRLEDMVHSQVVSFLPAGESTWSEPTTVGDDSELTGFYDVARAGDTSVIVWGAMAPPRLFARVREGTDSTPLATVREKKLGAGEAVRVQADTRGNAAAVWVESDEAGETIWSSYFSAKSQEWEKAVTLVDTPHDAVSSLEFRLSGDGKGLMFFTTVEENMPSSVGCAYLDDGAWDLSCEVPQAGGKDARYPSLALGDERTIHLAWARQQVLDWPGCKPRLLHSERPQRWYW